MNIPKRVKNVDTGVIYNSVTEAAAAVYITYTAIVAACRGRRKTAAGYRWRYM